MVRKTKYGDYATWVTFKIFSKFRVRVIFTEDLANSAGKRIGNCGLKGNADAACYNTKDGWSLMFLNPKADEGTIVHESWHIIFELMDYVGAKIENEVVAYHLGYLVNEIHTFKRKVLDADQKSGKPSKVSSKRGNR